MGARSWIWFVVAACGGSGELAAPKPPAPPAIAPTTCADAGVILRGKVTSSDDAAGPAREAAIAAACTEDHWAPSLLACIAASRTPDACLGGLSPAVAASYQARLAEWATHFDEASDADTAPPETPCDLVAEAVPRSSDDVSLERDWVIDARKRVVQAECTVWHEPAKACLTAEQPPPDLASCLGGETTKAAFAAKLDQIGDRAKKISVAKQKPVTITCAKVAAAYYADAEWKGKLDGATPKDRKKAITGSRAAMQKACTDDKWDATIRACFASGGGAMCFDESQVIAADWGFPASATVVRALPPPCLELERRAQSFKDCTAVDQETRDQIAHLRTLIEREAKLDPDGVGPACEAGLEAMSQLPKCP